MENIQNIQKRLPWVLGAVGIVLIVAYFALSDTAEAPAPDTMVEATSTPEVALAAPVYPGVSVVQVPFIAIGGFTGATSTDMIGCGDRLVYVKQVVDKTAQPLNASYRELFAASTTVSSDDLTLTNEVANQANLKFVRAAINGAVASVYLEGELLSNECADPRIKAQIEFTAKQFPNITEVKTYLNGAEFDWRAFGNQKDAEEAV